MVNQLMMRPRDGLAASVGPGNVGQLVSTARPPPHPRREEAVPTWSTHCPLLHGLVTALFWNLLSPNFAQGDQKLRTWILFIFYFFCLLKCWLGRGSLKCLLYIWQGGVQLAQIRFTLDLLIILSKLWWRLNRSTFDFSQLAANFWLQSALFCSSAFLVNSFSQYVLDYW